MMHRTLAALTVGALAACSSAKTDETAAMDSAATAAPAAATAEAPATGAKDIVETAVAAGTFNTLAKALTAAGLVETLKGTGPFTVLAPTDEAFAKIPAKDLEALLADKAALTKVLTYHVIAGNNPSSVVTTMTDAATVEGSKVEIKVVDGKVMLNGKATVTSADIAASNGVIHVIDTVLMPPKM
ncbi:MAG TPA: fasciclin domain-containing protein [Gemmatimonadaceae bacterium]|nr:fasciclin domain-containing protein [Gemmatimonadaceae bacterium]